MVRSDPNPGVLRWLLHGFYDGIWLLAIALAFPWLLFRMARSAAFKQMVHERLALRSLPAAGARRRVLVHGVSVGEIKGAAPLVRRILEQFPTPKSC